MILHDRFSIIPTPAFIRDNRSYLESLPFDGIVVNLVDGGGSDLSAAVMRNRPVTYRQLTVLFAPLQDQPFTSLTHNYALVFSNRPADFFDDWSVAIQNFANLARAARDAGLTGVVFDNEAYFRSWANYPDDVRYASRTLSEYQDQARLRGRQVMSAMLAEFPDIEVLCLHGPYASEPKAPSPLFPDHQWSVELLGPFFTGFLEAASGRAKVIDGGELYGYLSPREFSDSYNWRKYQLASEAVNSAFIPGELRASWAARTDISFGLYDKTFGTDSGVNVMLLRSTVANAMRQADSIVWFYTEAVTFLKPPGEGGATAAWVNAIRDGRNDASRSRDLRPPSAPSAFSAKAVSSYQVTLSWNSGDDDTEVAGYRIYRDGRLLSNVTGTTYSDNDLFPSTRYEYRVAAYDAAGNTSAQSAAAVAGTLAGPPRAVSRNQSPSVVSVSPSAGEGTAQVFGFAFADPDGADDLVAAAVLINESVAGVASCWLYYRLPDHYLMLATDDGESWPGANVGSGVTLENRQCSIRTDSVSVSKSENGLVLTIPIRFKPSFRGTRTIYLWTSDRAGASDGFNAAGAWRVGAPH